MQRGAALHRDRSRLDPPAATAPAVAGRFAVEDPVAPEADHRVELRRARRHRPTRRVARPSSTRRSGRLPVRRSVRRTMRTRPARSGRAARPRGGGRVGRATAHRARRVPVASARWLPGARPRPLRAPRGSRRGHGRARSRDQATCWRRRCSSRPAMPSARNAAVSSDVIAVLPLVAETSVTTRPRARRSSASGTSISVMVPGSCWPEPRPLRREANPAARPAAIARRSRIRNREAAARCAWGRVACRPVPCTSRPYGARADAPLSAGLVDGKTRNGARVARRSTNRQHRATQAAARVRDFGPSAPGRGTSRSCRAMRRTQGHAARRSTRGNGVVRAW